VTGFVLDASVTMAWCFEAHSDDYCTRVLDALAECRAIAPDIWILEILSTLLVAERKRRLRAEQSDAFLETLWRLPIDVESAAARTPWSSEVLLLARANGLSSYDAAYLEFANRKSLPLATCDTVLRRAANRSGVPLFLIGSHG
jgi:predicted nucleic acid-binding protein